MKRKLIAIDIDGTVSKNGSLLTPKAIEVLSKLVDEGHEIVFASGRPVRAIMPYYEAIGCHSPMIAYNGLWAHRPQSFGKKPGYSFKKEDVQEIYDALKDKLTAFMAESETTIYSSYHNDYLDLFFPYKGMKEITEHDLKIGEDVLTVIFNIEPENYQALEEAVNSYPEYGLRHWTGSTYSELYRRGITKGSGLKLIQNKLKFSKDDTVAIGDSDNDLEMLDCAKYAYAMKGSKSKRLLASFPATDYAVEEDGAVLMLEKLFLK